MTDKAGVMYIISVYAQVRVRMNQNISDGVSYIHPTAYWHLVPVVLPTRNYSTIYK
jgi:hypothetical protein